MAEERLQILFFSPYQFIEKHTYPEAFFANLLRKGGHEVTLLGCDRLYRSFCIAHASEGLSETSAASSRERICTTCVTNRKAMEQAFDSSLLLNDFYETKRESEIADLLKPLNVDDIYTLEFHGFPVGRIASYEFLIHYKISDVSSMSKEFFELYKVGLANTIRTLFAVEKILAERKFDRIFIFNTNYATNAMVRALGEINRVPVAGMHLGLNLAHMDETMWFTYRVIPYYLRQLPLEFASMRSEFSLDFSKYGLVIDHLRELSRAKSFFVYSTERTGDTPRQREVLGLDDKKYKKTVLLTTSSLDETYAEDFSILGINQQAETKSAFPDQVSWIREVIGYFRARPEYKLILRIHPREFPNKREGRLSQRVMEYIKIFDSLPSNVVVNQPDQKISFYDILDFIDLHLVSISSTAMESAALGIPTIGYTTERAIHPLSYVNEIIRERSAYFQRLDAVLETGDFDSKGLAWRALEWNLFFFSKVSIEYSTEKFWENAKIQKLSWRLVNKLRRILGKPRYSVTSFLRNSHITDYFNDLFLRFVGGSIEFIDLRRLEGALQNASPSSMDQKYFRAYIIGVIEVFYGIDLQGFEYFLFIDSINAVYLDRLKKKERTCVFVLDSQSESVSFERNNGSVLIRLPKKQKALVRLAFIAAQIKI